MPRGVPDARGDEDALPRPRGEGISQLWVSDCFAGAVWPAAKLRQLWVSACFYRCGSELAKLKLLPPLDQRGAGVVQPPQRRLLGLFFLRCTL